MAKKFKRLVFHKGRNTKKTPSLKLDYDFEMVSNISHWPSALMVSLKKHFDEIIYLHSVPNDKYAREFTTINGIKCCVVSVKDLESKWMHECDVFFHRAFPFNMKPPSMPITVSYSSSSNVTPLEYSNEWDVLLTSMFAPKQPNVNLGNNLYSWIKGDNETFWQPSSCEKEFDFVVVARRLKRMEHVIKIAKENPNIKIAVFGWAKYVRNHWEPEYVFSSIDNITEFGRGNHVYVRDVLRRSKIGIAAVTRGGEGYPMQTQMEYSLTGLYTVYDKFMLEDGYYINDKTGRMFSDIGVLKNWKKLGQGARKYAINNFSSEVSANSFMKIISLAQEKLG